MDIVSTDPSPPPPLRDVKFAMKREITFLLHDPAGFGRRSFPFCESCLYDLYFHIYLSTDLRRWYHRLEKRYASSLFQDLQQWNPEVVPSTIQSRRLNYHRIPFPYSPDQYPDIQSWYQLFFGIYLKGSRAILFCMKAMQGLFPSSSFPAMDALGKPADFDLNLVLNPRLPESVYVSLLRCLRRLCISFFLARLSDPFFFRERGENLLPLLKKEILHPIHYEGTMESTVPSVYIHPRSFRPTTCPKNRWGTVTFRPYPEFGFSLLRLMGTFAVEGRRSGGTSSSSTQGHLYGELVDISFVLRSRKQKKGSTFETNPEVWVDWRHVQSAIFLPHVLLYQRRLSVVPIYCIEDMLQDLYAFVYQIHDVSNVLPSKAKQREARLDALETLLCFYRHLESFPDLVHPHWKSTRSSQKWKEYRWKTCYRQIQQKFCKDYRLSSVQVELVAPFLLGHPDLSLPSVVERTIHFFTIEDVLCLRCLDSSSDGDVTSMEWPRPRYQDKEILNESPLFHQDPCAVCFLYLDLLLSLRSLDPLLHRPLRSHLIDGFRRIVASTTAPSISSKRSTTSKSNLKSSNQCTLLVLGQYRVCVEEALAITPTFPSWRIQMFLRWIDGCRRSIVASGASPRILYIGWEFAVLLRMAQKRIHECGQTMSMETLLSGSLESFLQMYPKSIQRLCSAFLQIVPVFRLGLSTITSSSRKDKEKKSPPLEWQWHSDSRTTIVWIESLSTWGLLCRSSQTMLCTLEEIAFQNSEDWIFLSPQLAYPSLAKIQISWQALIASPLYSTYSRVLSELYAEFFQWKMLA